MRVLIIGGGAIGTSIAYFLSRRGADVTVIERTGIACAASGKSGGFLALDWCDGDPAAVTPDPGALERLEAICRALSPRLATAKILARQACYRPVTANGLPLIGAVPGIEGAYVATGHSVWGILNAPGTGEAMAEMVITSPNAFRR